MLIGRGLEEENESRQQEVVLSKKLERVVIEENVVVVVVQGGPSKRNGAVGNCRASATHVPTNQRLAGVAGGTQMTLASQLGTSALSTFPRLTNRSHTMRDTVGSHTMLLTRIAA